uniref:Uncharacterized protein n=1 Tax=Cacopsylla melanoneura TaxID=428564 RepID=A0A8D8Y5Q0_9HEMI
MFKSYLMGSKLLSIPVVCLLAKQMAPFPELNSPTCYVMGLLGQYLKVRNNKAHAQVLGIFNSLYVHLDRRGTFGKSFFFALNGGTNFISGICLAAKRTINVTKILFFSSLLMFVFDKRIKGRIY